MSILSSLAAEFVSYYKAILSRSMFSMHALVAVWRTTVIMGAVYWSLVVGIVLLVLEYFVTMWVRMGEEWPWISPSTLCYLTTAAAALWVQKLESLGHIQSVNGTYVSTLPSTGMNMDFSASDWLLLTEQTMMVTIILSRWLLPKGTMSHKDLSTLLLLYLALSADILDFSTIFSEPTVAKDVTFCYVILVVWTGSLAQFMLVLTNTASVDKEESQITLKSIVCSSEVWQILVQIGLQDMPFLLVRVIALLQYQVFNYTIIFFVCKNTLVICLELYHLVATCVEQQRKLRKRKERMAHLKSKMVSVKKVIGLSKLQNMTQTLKKGEGTKGDDNNAKNQLYQDGGKSASGDSKSRKGNVLSLFAAGLSKAKNDDERGTGNTEQSVKDKVNGEVPLKPHNTTVQNGTTGNKTAQFANKPVITKNLLFSTLKNPGLKEHADTRIQMDKPSVKSDLATSTDVARSGSELAGENNNLFNNNHSVPVFLLDTEKGMGPIISGGTYSTGNKTATKANTEIKTVNMNEDEKSKHQQLNFLDEPPKTMDYYLHRQGTSMSTPPVSHLRPFNSPGDSTTSNPTRPSRSNGSLQWIDGKSEPREIKTRKSLFDEDASVF